VAFFQNEEGKVIHTGIMAGNGTIIHASGKVRIDPVDSTGIFNQKRAQYTHYLRVIKRLIVCPS
jgi:cell wall-associated NlpC family hydrolase